MWIHEANLTHIKYKRKTVEARLATGAMQRVFPGDIIRFECASWGAPISLDVKVLSLLKYDTFKELLEHEGLKNCLPDVADITTGISHVNSAIANYTAGNASKYGVLAFRITPDINAPVPRPLVIVRGGRATHVLTQQQRELVTTQVANIQHIIQKRKVVEGCIATKGMLRVFPGEIFTITDKGQHLDVKVLSMVKYTSFKDMLEHEGLVNCLPDCPSIAAGVAVYHNFENYETLAKKLGVIALRITPDLNDDTPLPRPLLTTRGGTTTHVLTRQEIQLLTNGNNASSTLVPQDTNKGPNTIMPRPMTTGTTMHTSTQRTRSRSRSRQQ